MDASRDHIRYHYQPTNEPGDGESKLHHQQMLGHSRILKTKDFAVSSRYKHFLIRPYLPPIQHIQNQVKAVAERIQKKIPSKLDYITVLPCRSTFPVEEKLEHDGNKLHYIQKNAAQVFAKNEEGTPVVLL